MKKRNVDCIKVFDRKLLNACVFLFLPKKPTTRPHFLAIDWMSGHCNKIPLMTFDWKKVSRE